MKTNLYYTVCTLIAVVLPLGSCNDDDWRRNQTGSGNASPIVLSGEIDQVYKTRVNDNGFCDGDKMGIYIVDYKGNQPEVLHNTGNRADNLSHTFDEKNNKWMPAHDVYWKDNNTHVDIYGYYPAGTPEEVNNYAFEVQKDQSKSAANGNLGGYEASDFLWGKAGDVAPTANVIRLSLTHRMSNACITLKEGTGFLKGEWTGLEKSILVMNTKRNANINLSTGSVTVSGDLAPTGIIAFKNNDEFRAIVVPQTIAATTLLFLITVNGVNYTFKKEETFEYVATKMMNFTIVINKKETSGGYEFKLVNESVTAWENDLVSHEATAREYIIIDAKEPGKLKEYITNANKDFTQLQHLKITGRMNAYDFVFMRDKMSKLQSLNLKEVKIEKVINTNQFPEDVIPKDAMSNKSLIHLILPDRLKGIEENAFYKCPVTGSLIIPEGVITIGNSAFMNCTSFTDLALPATLEYIGDNAFLNCNFSCELKLPNNLKTLGKDAFRNCKEFYGTLKLPDNLSKINSSIFSGCSGFTGSLSIPQSVKIIDDEAFFSNGFDGTLSLHDGITYIGKGAFQRCHFKGELVLPKKLITISKNAFAECDFSGELKLPKGLTSVGNYAFSQNKRITGVLEIPQNVTSIGERAFFYCTSLEGLILPDGVESIQKNAFYICRNIRSIICKSMTPPHLLSEAFSEVPKDNFTVEVPEQSVSAYQMATGWNEFKRIAAHRELICRPYTACAINTKCSRTLVLEAEGDWEMISKPDWCSLSQTSGSKKAELKLTFSEMPKGVANRSGEIIFELKNKDYTCKCTVNQYNYQYAEDEIITLQQHSKGKGVNLVFLGDGYDAKDIASGGYLKDMKNQVENFFGIEPYKTYRPYFNIYTAIALSPESGIGTVNTIRYTKFETTLAGGVGLKANYDALLAYACQMPTVNKNNLNQSLIILTPNTSEYGGVCHMWEDGSAIAFCPKSTYDYPSDTRGVIQHEAGGHGFGKLGDEYIYHNEFIDFCTCFCCGHTNAFKISKSHGWYDNLSLTGKMDQVPWSHLIFDDRYSKVVDIFEGGYMHSRGVFRSEPNSCMNINIPYYSTISRESIVKRIKAYAGEAYSFEEFKTNDKETATTITRAASTAPYWRSNAGIHQHAPVIHKGKNKFSQK